MNVKHNYLKQKTIIKEFLNFDMEPEKKQKQEKIQAEENKKCPICNSVLGDEAVCAVCTINIEKISDAEKAKYENEQKEEESKQSVKNFLTRKPKLNIVLLGHVDAGKSTIAGHLAYKMGAVGEKEIKKYQNLSYEYGKSSFKYAWVVDKLMAERERGITIESSTIQFETQLFRIALISTPGLRDFMKNTIRGITQSDCAIMVVAGSMGQFQAGMSKEGQTRTHLSLAKTFGIQQLIICVNKLQDMKSPEKRFEVIKAEIMHYLKKVGYKSEKVIYVPVSGFMGDNLIEKSEKFQWFKGPTLLEAINGFTVPKRKEQDPLRIPVEECWKIAEIGTVVSGRIISGKIKSGMKVRIAPSSLQGEVNELRIMNQRVLEASSGQNVSFNIKGISSKDIRRGQVIGEAQNSPPQTIKSFTARIMIIQHPGAIRAGYSPVMNCHSVSFAGKFKKFISIVDPMGKLLDENPTELRAGQNAIIQIEPVKPVSIEKFSEFPKLGRFCIRDMRAVVGVGVVLETVRSQEKSPETQTKS